MTNLTIITAASLVCLALWAACSLDSFGTMILSLPALLFFLIMALNAILKAVNLKNPRELKPLIIAIFGFVLLFSVITMSDHGLTDLTKERERKMIELRSVIIKYRQEQGAYPEKLELLVPRYIHEIPEVLRVSSEKEDPYKRVTYGLENGMPVFRYRVARGPDSGAMFDVESGKIVGEM